MKTRWSAGFFVVVTALVVAGGAGLASQWSQTMALRSELELARIEAGELEQLRAENKRLRDRQIPAAELELLRADHAALPGYGRKLRRSNALASSGARAESQVGGGRRVEGWAQAQFFAVRFGCARLLYGYRPHD